MDILKELQETFPDYNLSIETERDTKNYNLVSNHLFINGVPLNMSWSALLEDDIHFEFKESADEMLLDTLIDEISKSIGLNEKICR